MKTNAKISTETSSNLTSHFSRLTSNSRGITLIALIITIIVMLILAGVSISIAINGGLFDTTKKAAKETEEAKNAEQELANGRVKIDGAWYDSIEDYVGGKKSDNQTEPEKPEEPEKPPEEKVKPQIGDYVLYEPDTVSSPYLLEGRYSGYGDYNSSTTPYTFATPKDQSIAQEKLQWQVLKVHDNGVIDLIGTPTTNWIYFGGALGYNNGVYLLHDICKELYSKQSKGIYARSVSLEDFEDESNGGIWRNARDSYTTGEVQYGHTKTYIDAGTRHYPSLYAEENGSGINTTSIKTDGIKNTDKGYDSLTEETSSEASGILTVTQNYYEVQIDKTNYGKTTKILNNSKLYWIASRYVYGDDLWSEFGLLEASTQFFHLAIMTSDGGLVARRFSLRPVVSLGSSVQLSLKTEGTTGAPNTFEITKY